MLKKESGDDGQSKTRASSPPPPAPPTNQTTILNVSSSLSSVKPLLTEDEFRVTEQLFEKFCAPGGEAETMQSYLQQRVDTTDNWLAELWQNHSYLDYRAALPINSSTGNLHPLRPYKTKAEQLELAAAAIAGALRFKQRLYDEDYPVEKMGPYPLEMEQFYNFLGSCRIPGETRDSFRVLDPENPPQHIIVVHNYHYFYFPVYGASGAVMNQSQILSHLQQVVSQSPSPSASPIGILATEERDVWYSAYTALHEDQQNAKNLDLIASSLFLLCLDGLKSPSEVAAANAYSAAALKMMHGGGYRGNSANRWCDKAVQLVVGVDGELGLPFEHSSGDGNAIAVLMDNVEDYCINFGGSKDAVPAACDVTAPSLLQFNVPDQVKTMFQPAFDKIDRVAEELDMYLFAFTNYGKGFIKTQNVSPDSYFQMALQYTFYKVHGEVSAQYESAATRMFRHGRTETIRSCSLESVHFARVMMDPAVSDVDKATAMRNAIKSHKDYVSWAVQGQGVDRHLLGLRLMASQHGLPEPEIFRDKAYTKSTQMRLSTSQVPMRCDAYIYFAPLVKDGYGICYNLHEDKMLISTSAFNSCEQTSARVFSDTLATCLDDMRAMLEKAAQSN